jgi:eukaryotic-like serine/threonine-protein kinase
LRARRQFPPTRRAPAKQERAGHVLVSGRSLGQADVASIPHIGSKVLKSRSLRDTLGTVVHPNFVLGREEVSFDPESQDNYAHFRDIVAERTNPIVVWVGSGLSAPAGIPTWNTLRKSLCDTLLNKAKTFAEPDAEALRSAHSQAWYEKNLWVAFKILREALGRTTYAHAVREQLKKGVTAKIPDAYEAVWDLRPAGILNLNLDRLASRAYAELHPKKQLYEFNGADAGDHAYVLRSTVIPFVANLHGVLDSENSWVFTYDDLKTLSRNSGYRHFIHACALARTILFVGISADDGAAGGHLERLHELGTISGPHFWITDRLDKVTDDWAEKSGIKVIRYANEDSSHSELLQLLKALPKYKPQDTEELRPVVTVQVEGATAGPFPQPAELAKEPAETIRRLLNEYVKQLLERYKNDQAEGYRQYEAFCRAYDHAIHTAWYVSDQAPNNQLLGYMIYEEVGKGAFGTIYRAVDSNGQQVALKLLHEGVRSDPEMLQGFRRGIRSMSILSKEHIDGVAPYLDASEIPAFVVMEFIEGRNLKDMVSDRLITDWTTVLWVAHELVTIIRASHQLPERVLHRDIRPANVMIQGGWVEERADWKVVVLDFDLSWHRDAPERSVGSPGFSGYLAPEQIIRDAKNSTKSALVDSFGLGMTLFFLRTGTDPVAFQHLHRDWTDRLKAECRRYRCHQWTSAPVRYFRLIDWATQQQQDDRCDVSQIKDELKQLLQAVQNPSAVRSAELLAEELAHRAFPVPYHWNRDTTAAEAHAGGLTIALQGLEKSAQVKFMCGWSQQGNERFETVRKWLPNASNAAEAALRRKQWRIENRDARDNYQFELAATMTAGEIAADHGRAVAGLSEAIAALQFQ